ncbi:MAG: glycosyltransferase family 1 protein [Bryobacteraceae bacterium]
MRVSIDATPTLLRSAGVKSYLYHWIRSLHRASATHPNTQIHAFPALDDVLFPEQSSDRLNHEASPLGLAGTISRLALVHSARVFGAPLLDRAIGRADVFHASNLVRNAPGSAKLTATLHDLTTWIMPGMHASANIQADQVFAEKIVSRADGLIAVSENTRQDAIRLLGISPDKITTIHSGVAPEYFDAKPVPRARPYVLFVGTVEPRKNLDTLLDAWQMVRAETRREFDLVVAGPKGWGPEATFARVQAETTYLGYVPESQMPGLFAGATLFVYPSFYEGFGFPVVQALAAKVPVVTSNTSCLPEVARDGAALIDPKSPVELASAIERLLESPADRAKLAGYGRASAERFRWEKCAERSLEFFRRIAG